MHAATNKPAFGQKKTAMRGALLGLCVLALVVACSSKVGARPAAAAASHQSNLITTVAHVGDIRVVSATTPQSILMTPAENYDGSPIQINLTIEYVNEIPDPTTTSNGISFFLYEDGKYVMQLALFGAHLANSQPMFAPLNASTMLDGTPGTEPAPTGRHVFSIAVVKWSPRGDGYLRGGDSAISGTPNPIRLTITYV